MTRRPELYADMVKPRDIWQFADVKLCYVMQWRAFPTLTPLEEALMDYITHYKNVIAL